MRQKRIPKLFCFGDDGLIGFTTQTNGIALLAEGAEFGLPLRMSTRYASRRKSGVIKGFLHVSNLTDDSQPEPEVGILSKIETTSITTDQFVSRAAIHH